MADFYDRFDTKKPVLVFGLKQFADLAAYVLEHDSPFNVAGFLIDKPYRTLDVKHQLPVVDFDTLEQSFKPDEVYLLISLSYQDMNGVRRSRYEDAKARGYQCISYVSSKATTWPDLQVGENSFIYENTVIQPYATVGHNCVIRSSVHISHHVHVGDHCFFAPGVVTGGNVVIEEQCVLGLGSIVRDSVRLAKKTFVGAGAVVTKDTDENGLYVGIPARLQSVNTFGI